MESLKIAEVATIFGVTKRTILNWFHANKFPNAFKVNRTIRIPHEDVEALKNNSKDSN